ncbi:HSF-type DNA-binding-domain-containing protein [Dipodascopsis uninucleata]
MAESQNSNSANATASGSSSNSGGSSSDFVKKLFKMLEDPSYRDIVRWGDSGDSFVVIETNEFTKSILPRHFKHSNFASFVRQLNKYDFHKVRSTDEVGTCLYGESAWEFKHPDFQLHNKTQLDNIKRKAPAPRRSTQAEENNLEQINKLEQEVEQLKTQNSSLSKHIQGIEEAYEHTLNSMIMMQRSNDARDEIIRGLLSQLQTLYAHTNTPQRYPGTPDVDFSHPSASTIIGQSEEFQGLTMSRQDQGLDYLNELSKRLQVVSASTSSQLYMQQQQILKEDRPKKFEDMDQANNGIVGPSSADHSSVSAAGLAATGQDANMMDIERSSAGPQDGVNNHTDFSRSSKSPSSQAFGSGWAVPPKVLLVEDDATSRRVSGKFLQLFGCEADIAVDGLAAVNRMNMAKYDIVLMDIVMPNLDGVSATSLIRQFDPLTPIIAMTGNVSGNDVIAYYSHGMNDVLAKPFTKENLLAILEKHLIHLKEMKEM